MYFAGPFYSAVVVHFGIFCEAGMCEAQQTTGAAGVIVEIRM